MNSSLQNGAENAMSIRIGYLLPTRERIMAGQPQAAPLLELAERAERLGFDSVWAGDSLLARPRHEPLTLLAAVASRVRRVDIGTAVLLPALRNPVPATGASTPQNQLWVTPNGAVVSWSGPSCCAGSL